jgi:hypothetical protein
MKLQATAALAADTWSITSREDRARDTITFANLKGTASHTRSLVYQRGRGVWVVVDRVQSDRARHVEGLWHAHPDCNVTLGPGAHPISTISNNKTGVGIEVVQASGCQGWTNITIVSGQTEPVLQGWFSQTYGDKAANPTLSYTSLVSSGVSTFAWLIVPTTTPSGKPPTAHVGYENATHVTVQVGYDSVAVQVEYDDADVRAEYDAQALTVTRVTENVTVEIPVPR